jgi:hypothetical protein
MAGEDEEEDMFAFLMFVVMEMVVVVRVLLFSCWL